MEYEYIITRINNNPDLNFFEPATCIRVVTHQFPNHFASRPVLGGGDLTKLNTIKSTCNTCVEDENGDRRWTQDYYY